MKYADNFIPLLLVVHHHLRDRRRVHDLQQPKNITNEKRIEDYDVVNCALKLLFQLLSKIISLRSQKMLFERKKV